MKNFKLFTLVMLATALVFSSCTKDEEEIAKPTIKFVGTDNSVEFDMLGAPHNADFFAKITAEAKIKEFTIKETITKDNDEIASADYDVETTKKAKGEKAFDYNFKKMFTQANFTDAKKIEYLFTVTDKENQSVEKRFTITKKVAAVTTPLANEVSGAIFNLAGSEKGAWDLVADMAKALGDADADKDMANTTPNNDATNFRKEWEAKNATTFVKVMGMPYEQFDSEEAAKGYFMSQMASASAKAENVAKGNVYVAKLRGEENYAVIKVTDIVETDGDNNDKIVFTYKKK